jgi:hypothetical protein
MDVANLQIEGLCLAHAALHRLLIAKGLVTTEEIGAALQFAEAELTGEDRCEELSPALRDAVVFPLRVMRVAAAKPLNDPLSFADLAKTVGRTKQPYNDQL